MSLRQAQLGTLAARGEVTAAVERQLRQRLRDNPSMSEIASALHLGERTLRRRLEEAGTSFREISDRLRAQAAHRLLQQQDLSMAEASRQLGFSDVRAFRRACKRWLGRTPGQVRQTAPDG